MRACIGPIALSIVPHPPEPVKYHQPNASIYTHHPSLLNKHVNEQTNYTALARLVTLLVKQHPRLLHAPASPERADLEAAAQSQSQSQQPAAAGAGAATTVPFCRQCVRLLRERRKAGSKLGSRVYGQELKLASLVLALLGKEAGRQRRRRRRRKRGGREGGEMVVEVDEQYVRDEARLLLQACHRLLGAEEVGGKAPEALVVAGALGAVDRVLGLTEGPFAGPAGGEFLYAYLFDKVGESVGVWVGWGMDVLLLLLLRLCAGTGII